MNLPEGDSGIFIQNSIIASDFHRLVSKKRNFHFTESTLFTWRVDPDNTKTNNHEQALAASMIFQMLSKISTSKMPHC